MPYISIVRRIIRYDFGMPKTTALQWTGAITGIAGAAVLAAHVPWSGWGFVFYLASNCCWYAYGRRVGSGAMMLMQAVFTVISLAGVWRWLA